MTYKNNGIKIYVFKFYVVLVILDRYCKFTIYFFLLLSPVHVLCLVLYLSRAYIITCEVMKNAM